MRGETFFNIVDFHKWQGHKELLDACDLVSKEMSHEAFIAERNEFEKTVQEAIVSANFALRCDAL